MRFSAGLLLSSIILAGLLSACQQNDALLPKDPARRQKSLSDRILDRALRPDSDQGFQEDVALALGEVVMTTDAPKLRLIVTNGSPSSRKGLPGRSSAFASFARLTVARLSSNA